jgi:hypothetical protein
VNLSELFHWDGLQILSIEGFLQFFEIYVRQILLIKLHESVPTFFWLIPICLASRACVLVVIFACFSLVLGFSFFLFLAVFFVRISDLLFPRELIKNVVGVFSGYFQSIVLILFSGWVSFSASDRGEAILFLPLSCFRILGI